MLALPTAVFEGPSFGYTDTAVRSCFDMVIVFLISLPSQLVNKQQNYELKHINVLPKDKILDQSKLKAFCRRQIKGSPNGKTCAG